MEKMEASRIAGQRQWNGQDFPLVLTPSPDAAKWQLNQWCDWLQQNQQTVDKQLLKYGALLFRGFPIDSPQDFHNWIESTGLPAFPYVGGAAPRKVVTERVFTANEAPPSELIPFHHEMAQVPEFPKVLFFYCNVEPPEGGETPLTVSNIIYQKMCQLQPDFVKDLEKMGVRYVRVMPNGDDPLSPIGRGWQSTYQTEDKGEAEKRAREQGTEVKWLEDGSLHTVTKVLPAIRKDERTGKQTWFNSIIAAYLGWQDSRNDRKKAITFADGSLMPEEAMDMLEKVFNDTAADCRWRVGDIMMVDNRQVLHSRRAYTPPRRILAALCKDRN